MAASKWICFSVLALGLAGCATEPSSQFKVTDLAVEKNAKVSNTRMGATDARLRIITSSPLSGNSQTGIVDPYRINCVEPSPDVAITVANSFATGLSIFGQGSGSISGSSVQAMAQLVERTASIQLLRDKMYQTCLAYSNGAISGTTYSLVMSRLDDTIVSLLLGETAGGAFGRSLAGTGGNANGEATATLIGLPAGLQGIESASNELALEQAKVDEKAEALRAAEAKVAGVENPPQADLDAVRSAKTELADAKAERDRLLNGLKSQADTMAKSAAAASAVTGGGLTQRTDPEIARTLLGMQREFLSKNSTDLIINACLVEMGLNTGKSPTQLAQYCEAQLPEVTAQYATQYGVQFNKKYDSLTKIAEEQAKTAESAAGAAKSKAEQEKSKVTTASANAAAAASTAAAEAARSKAEEAKAARAAAFSRALTTCDGIKDGAQRNACIKQIVAALD